MGADGIGIWYTPDHAFSGPAYGAPAKWTGLLVALDTFDNTVGRCSPTLSVLTNDGTKAFDAGNNGQPLSIGACKFNFRNTGHFSKVVISYNTLSEDLSVSYAENADVAGNVRTCYSGKVSLPKNGLFGVTAATGDLSDNHEIKSFVVKDMNTLSDSNSANKQRNEELFRQYQERIKQYNQNNNQNNQNNNQKSQDVKIPDLNMNQNQNQKGNFVNEKVRRDDINLNVNPMPKVLPQKKVSDERLILEYGKLYLKKVKAMGSNANAVISNSANEQKQVDHSAVKKIVEDAYNVYANKMFSAVQKNSADADNKKVAVVKEKIAQIGDKVKTIPDKISELQNKIDGSRTEAVAKIKSRTNYGLIFLVVLSQVVIFYVVKNWKTAQKEEQFNRFF